MKTDRELMTICEGWVGGRSPDKVESMNLRSRIYSAIEAVDDLSKLVSEWHGEYSADFEILTSLKNIKDILESED
jgi:hypothetical protein